MTTTVQALDPSIQLVYRIAFVCPPLIPSLVQLFVPTQQ